MGKDYAVHNAGKLAEELYERFRGLWENLDAKGELPRNADEFAETVVHVLFDTLAAGVMKVNS